VLNQLRKKIAYLSSDEADSSLSKVVDYSLILLISLNVLAVILESIPSFDMEYHNSLLVFEIFSVLIFSIEYFLRIWSAVDLKEYQGLTPAKARLRYILSPMAIIDLLAIIPFYLMIFINFDLRFLRILRLLRIFKLTRYSGAMNLVLNVFKEEAGAFFAAFFVLLLLLILASSGIYLFEHQAQPKAFGTIPDAMWWAMATLTTVGYGDVVPITPFGKLFGGFITIIGVGMVALPAGILASGFSDLVHRRRTLYSSHLEQALNDGALSPEDETELEALREKLGLSNQDIEDVTHAYLQKNQGALTQCPHCDKPLL